MAHHGAPLIGISQYLSSLTNQYVAYPLAQPADQFSTQGDIAALEWSIWAYEGLSVGCGHGDRGRREDAMLVAIFVARYLNGDGI